MYLSSRFRKKNAIVSLLLVFMFLMSIIVAPHADALNAGSGSKENSFVGYRYLNSTQIQIWADKNIGSTFYPGQYKIYEGNDPSIGQQIDVASVAAGSGPNVSGITGLSGGGSIKITSAEAFMPGHVYTIVVTNTLKSNNGLTLGHVNNHKDIAFSFVAPDTPATPNVNGTYSSITPIMNNWPANNATNVPVEGLISFSLNVPMDNATASAFSNWTAKTSTLVLKKDGIPVIYDYSINSSPDGSIYAPIVSDDRTFVFFPMTGGGSSLSCNLDFNTSYTLEIPEIHLINGQTIPAQTISFTTASDDVPAAFSSKPTMSTTGDNLSFSWQTINAVTGAWPAATGYNVWASTDPYFNFIKLNSTPISAPTTSYDYDVSGLQPSTEYYFRVTAINGSAEGGFSDYVQATTPAAVTGTISNPSTTGFTLSLNPSVVGLVYGDFSLNNGGTVTDVNTTDNGATYNATANLSAGQTYTVAITKPGYTFNVANVIVPGTSTTVTGTISNPSTTGFTLSLNPSVAGLVYGDFSLNNGGTVTDVITTDNGATYNVTANLSAGQIYTVNINTAGYTFNIGNLVVPGGGGSTDTQAPTWTNNTFKVATKTGQEIKLEWYAATDNVGVTGYKIYQGSDLIGSVDENTTTFTYTVPSGSGTGQQTYSVQAGDAAGNWSTNGPSQTIGGKNLPLITEYGVYSYSPSSNTTPPSAIGSIKTSSPWKLSQVSCDFDSNVGIGIKFATNVAVDTYFSDNADIIQMLDASNNSVSIKVDRSGDGTSSDQNRNYLFVMPLESLKPGSSYKIIVGSTLTSNNGMQAGVEQEVEFTTTGTPETPVVGTITTDGPTYTNGTGSVDPAVGAIVGLGDSAKVVIPASALKGTSTVTVDVKKVNSPPAAPVDAKPASDVYEFTVGNNTTYSFANNVAITLSINTSAIGTDEIPAVFYYDESQHRWVNIGGTVSGSTISVQVNHFTKFAVFSIKKAAIVPVMPVVTFNDIAGHWAENSIKELVSLGAVGGYPDGSFKPDKAITRAEFVTILVKAFKLAPQNGRTFSDTDGHWAGNTIATAASYGISSGYADGTFRPDDLITREQMAAMIVKAAKLTLATEEISFADSNNISEWARSAIATVTKNGIMKGYPDNTVRPQGEATRAEAVSVIINALK